MGPLAQRGHAGRAPDGRAVAGQEAAPGAQALGRVCRLALAGGRAPGARDAGEVTRAPLVRPLRARSAPRRGVRGPAEPRVALAHRARPSGRLAALRALDRFDIEGLLLRQARLGGPPAAQVAPELVRARGQRDNAKGQAENAGLVAGEGDAGAEFGLLPGRIHCDEARLYVLPQLVARVPQAVDSPKREDRRIP